MSVRRAAAILLLTWLPSSPSLAGPIEHGDAVTRLRSEVEALMAAAQKDMQRAPELTREAEAERGRAEQLKKALAEALAEAESAEAALGAARTKTEAAIAALRAVKSKGEALGGYRAAAFGKLAANPSASRESATEGALADDATVASAMSRVSTEPVAAASRALSALNAALKAATAELASTSKALAVSAAKARGTGKKGRARAKTTRKSRGQTQGAQAAATLDALSEAVVSAAACTGVDGSLPDGESPRALSADVLLQRVLRVRERARVVGAKALGELRERLAREAKPLIALLTRERAAEVLASFSEEAARAFPGELAVHASRESLRAEGSPLAEKTPKTPAAASQLHRSVSKHAGGPCTPIGGK